MPSSDDMIADFLLRNPDRAFTVDEILKEIMPGTEINSAHLLTAREALRRLIESNLAEARRFPAPEFGNFKIYYTATPNGKSEK